MIFGKESCINEKKVLNFIQSLINEKEVINSLTALHKLLSKTGQLAYLPSSSANSKSI